MLSPELSSKLLSKFSSKLPVSLRIAASVMPLLAASTLGITTATLLTATPFVHVAHAQNAPLPFVSPMFTDNMVLQRQRPVIVWGWTTPGKTVKVSIDGKTGSAVANAQGKWVAKLPALPVGGPYTLTVTGAGESQPTTFKNILSGDVWVCSGQSNMEMGIGNVLNAGEEIASANYPEIRLFTVEKKVSTTPEALCKGKWDVCTPDTVKAGGWNGFSAVGYFFGRELYKNLKVPIGLIHTSWGGTPAEAWTSAEALQTMEDYKSRNPLVPERHDQNTPTTLYNGMIAPVFPYGIKGAIWYQGESNAGRAFQYRTLLPTMIKDWRDRWAEGNFPFYIVQLANWQQPNPNPVEDAWAELREAQSLTAQHSPNTGIAVTIDIGDAGDIHPKDKQNVGKRLALAALAQTYGKKLEYAGPTYKSLKVEGDKIRLTFEHVGGGLVAKGGDTLKGFAIAGEDKKFVWADAKIEGNSIVVSSSQVSSPVAVRYAWHINPVCNLFNKADLPASPFRTDSWPGITVNNK